MASPGFLYRLLGSPYFSSMNAFTTMDALTDVMVGGFDDAHWAVDYQAISPAWSYGYHAFAPFGYGALSPPLFLTYECGPGSIPVLLGFGTTEGCVQPQVRASDPGPAVTGAVGPQTPRPVTHHPEAPPQQPAEHRQSLGILAERLIRDGRIPTPTPHEGGHPAILEFAGAGAAAQPTDWSARLRTLEGAEHPPETHPTGMQRPARLEGQDAARTTPRPVAPAPSPAEPRFTAPQPPSLPQAPTTPAPPTASGTSSPSRPSSSAPPRR